MKLDWQEQGFFSALNMQERSIILERMKPQNHSDGETVFHRGDPGGFLIAVKKGRIRITLYSEDGKEVLLNLIMPGQVFGEFSFLDGHARSANAVAEGDCELMVLHRTELVPILDQNPDIAMKLLGHLSNLLRQSTDTIESLAFLSLHARLARALLRLALQYGREHKDGILIASDLNQTDISQLIASSRESVNKQLHQWQKEGFIQLHKDGIVIQDVEKLKNLSIPQ